MRERQPTSGTSSGKGSGNPGRFAVQLSERAERELNSLPPRTTDQIQKRLLSLETAPFPRGKAIRRIVGASVPSYRLRVGDYRVLYRIRGRNVLVAAVSDKKDVKRKIRQLFGAG